MLSVGATIGSQLGQGHDLLMLWPQQQQFIAAISCEQWSLSLRHINMCECPSAGRGSGEGRCQWLLPWPWQQQPAAVVAAGRGSRDMEMQGLLGPRAGYSLVGAGPSQWHCAAATTAQGHVRLRIRSLSGEMPLHSLQAALNVSLGACDS